MQAHDNDLPLPAGGDSLSDEYLSKALEAVRSRISRNELERAAIERAIAKAREEERLLQRLLELRRGTMREGESSAGPEHDVEVVDVGPEITTGKRHPAVLAVIDELTLSNRPVHISELMRLLGERSIPIPGAGTQANLIAHLRRDPRLVRTSRGMYGLAAWGLESMSPTPRKTRKKRFRVTSKRKDS